uniref:Uncharacterized protein n=1 Tax=Cannabis sativa TaxID=3483 RepID=A0A803PZ41_CANSA
MKETGNTSTVAEHTTPSTDIPSTTNSQRPLRDDAELQNLRAVLGLMQGHNNIFHHHHQDLRVAINLAFDEQRCSNCGPNGRWADLAKSSLGRRFMTEATKVKGLTEEGRLAAILEGIEALRELWKDH